MAHVVASRRLKLSCIIIICSIYQLVRRFVLYDNYGESTNKYRWSTSWRSDNYFIFLKSVTSKKKVFKVCGRIRVVNQNKKWFRKQNGNYKVQRELNSNAAKDLTKPSKTIPLSNTKKATFYNLQSKLVSKMTGICDIKDSIKSVSDECCFRYYYQRIGRFFLKRKATRMSYFPHNGKYKNFGLVMSSTGFETLQTWLSNSAVDQ